MALVEAIILGGMAGALIESGKRGLIKSWGATKELPPVVKLFTLVVLVGIPTLNAGTFGNFVIAVLATVGAFTVARWSAASVIILWGRLP